MRLNPESIARASSRHPWRTFAVWLVILVGSFTLVSAGLFNDALTNGIDFTNTPESKEAAQLMGIKAATVRVLASQARSALRRNADETDE